jgi:hypothetical protein
MVEHLLTLVEDFPGAANQTRCFTHILNLVAKSILHQFEARKKPDDDEPKDDDEATKAFAALARELELEDHSGDLGCLAEDSGERPGLDGEDLDNEAEDDEEGLCDERDGMSEEEEAELEENLVPIRLMLTKVNRFQLL